MFLEQLSSLSLCSDIVKVHTADPPMYSIVCDCSLIHNGFESALKGLVAVENEYGDKTFQ